MSLIGTDELQQTLSLVHRILGEKQRTLQQLHGESELGGNAPLQV